MAERQRQRDSERARAILREQPRELGCLEEAAGKPPLRWLHPVNHFSFSRQGPRLRAGRSQSSGDLAERACGGGEVGAGAILTFPLDAVNSNFPGRASA